MFQWLRELRRGHDERIVAVYFRLPDDEAVHVGRYGEPHSLMTAARAAAWVIRNPEGAQVVVVHRVSARNILGIRQVRQLVGWTEVPEASKKWGCVCPGCLPRGDRAFMRRVRGAFNAGISAMRSARSDEEALSALGSLEIPLERARGRIEPSKLLVLARSKNPRIRQTVARLLGLCAPTAARGMLERLVGDDDAAVRREGVEALAHAVGTRSAAKLLAEASDDAVAHFVDLIEYQVANATAIDALERFAQHSAEIVRASAFRVAGALLADFEGTAECRKRLEALARKSAGT